MPSYVSPGVYTIEKDISDYTPSINASIVGIVGFAAKGPTNKATLITSQNQLLRTFGNPSESIPGQGIEGALEILEQTNSMYFVRAATSDAKDASATVSVGACPSVIVSSMGYGVTEALTLKMQVYNNAGVAQFPSTKTFVIPAGTASYQAEAIRKVVGGGLDADKVGVFDEGVADSGLGLSGAIVGSFAGSGAYLEVSSYNSAGAGVSALMPVFAASSHLSNFGVSAEVAAASAVRVYGATFTSTGTSSLTYEVESLYPGAGYNGGTRTNGDTSGNSITIEGLGSQNFNIIVNEDGNAIETFKTSLVGSGAFVEDVINTGETNPTSEVIKGNIHHAGSDVAATKFTRFSQYASQLVGAPGFIVTSRWLPVTANPAGTGTAVDVAEHKVGSGSRWLKFVESPATNLAGGTNIGAVDSAVSEDDKATALIGDASVDPKTGMQALDDDILNIGIALVPGIYTESVQNNLVTLAETTQNFLTLVAPPYAIGTVQDAIDWSNGKSTSTAGSRSSAINSSYASIYFPHVKVFSVFDGKDRWYDPTIFAARQMAYTDAVSDSWFAPAGFRRGRLTKPSETEIKLNQGDRDTMYSGGNVLNPIVSFPQQGITIFGQRTAQREPSALDRINVRRLMIYIRKVILLAARRFVFEPNDEFTWAQIEGLLNPFLDDIRRRRGITEFRVVCDETVNTPVRVDRNELWTKVLVKPTKTAEILVFEINITNQSAQLGSL